MKKIQINSGLSSGLRSDFNLINTIEIEDKPFAVGGFGEVYYCISINGTAPFTKQVVKLFIDNSKGSAEHNFRTIQRLQKKVEKENQKLLSQQGKSLIELFPAFKGLPQYSFRGNLNGKNVIGFTSDNLVSLGYTDFEHILQDANLLKQYQNNITIEKKMLMAFQLVSAFKVLEEFHFIHADLKPGALFINLNSAEIAVIDYDSGVITENVNDEPLTWGAANDWVAPEIWEQQSTIQSGDKIKVDIYSDRWSVAIGVHYLMTTFHPLFYLTELSPRIAKQYFTQQNQWPFVNKTAPYFQKANEAIYDQYLPWVNSLPKVVKDKLSHTINFGYKNPVARTSYSDWKIALQAIQEPPKIKVFKSDKSAVIKSMDVELTWVIENAHTITIDNGIGQVPNSGSLKIKPQTDTRYKISAIGYFGQAADDIEIRVFPTPVLECLKVPMPDFQSRINLNPIKISSPQIDVSINLNSIYSEKPKFTEPSIDLRSIKATHMERTSIFNISKVYEAIRSKLSR